VIEKAQLVGISSCIALLSSFSNP